MKKFLRNLLYALLPVIIVNLIFWSALVALSWQEDLTYVNYASALDKEKRLEELAGKPRLVIIGGSNTRFSFDSRILEDSLGIEPVNMGIHIGLGLDYMFEQVATKLKAGDVLLVSAEYEHFMDMNTYRGDKGLTDMYLIRHEWGHAFSHIVNTHNFYSMYSLLRIRLKRISMKPEKIPSAMGVRTKYNKFGDYVGHYNLPPIPWNAPPLPQNPDKNVIADLKLKISRLRGLGVKVLMLPPPYCQSSWQTDSVAIHCLADSLKSANLPFCSAPGEFIYPDSLCYDSQYHLIRASGKLHSERVARILAGLLTKGMLE